MLGMGSVEMALAYLLCLAASAFCVGYGILHWNDKGKTVEQTILVSKEEK
ncbi:MAG: hypothetical protein PWR24_1158 [Desulfonauticus sp.]|jgi:hypothetical protein|nr:MAG: Uncharacterized protein XD41_1746 [Desulfonauticus sp. 38_4375]MDK2921601.1 hypothetical protein [Desulfonauticus sp.]